MLIPFLNPKITGITQHSLLVTVQQMTRGHEVVDVSGGGVDATNQPKRVFNATVHFHAGLPLIPFLGLAHLRIALTAFVLGGTRFRNDGGVDNPALAQHQAIPLQMLAHFLQQHLAKTMVLQEMTELEDRGFIRQTVQLQVSQVSHGFDFV